MNRYTDYDPFARVYNEHWGPHIQRFLPVVEQLLLHELPANARVLDLCCGTGQLAVELAGRGYHVTGIDGSSEMLNYARGNAPQVEFILADAREFTLPTSYHAALSMYDSLNHIMALDELAAAFRNVYNALLPGGYFLFDLNMHDGYLRNWHNSFGIVEDDHVVVARASYAEDERIGRIAFTIFRLEEQWARMDFTLTQRSYTESEVTKALEDAGFRVIDVSDMNGTIAGQNARPVQRAFFLAKKE